MWAFVRECAQVESSVESPSSAVFRSLSLSILSDGFSGVSFFTMIDMIVNVNREPVKLR